MKDIEEQLQDEGYQTFARTGEPGEEHPEHTHDFDVVHVILEGEMEIDMHGKTETLLEGARVSIPAGIPHAMRLSTMGCTYLVAEKHAEKNH